jgi:hypothetical protein
MQFTPYSLALADRQSEDDIDRLFKRLPQVEPPAELIARILSRIKLSPLSSADSLSRIQRTGRDFPAGGGLETRIIHNEKREPS